MKPIRCALLAYRVPASVAVPHIGEESFSGGYLPDFVPAELASSVICNFERLTRAEGPPLQPFGKFIFPYAVSFPTFVAKVWATPPSSSSFTPSEVSTLYISRRTRRLPCSSSVARIWSALKLLEMQSAEATSTSLVLSLSAFRIWPAQKRCGYSFFGYELGTFL